MFYKGYRFHLIVVFVLLFFLTGFHFQFGYLKKQLNEMESLNLYLYKHMLGNQMDHFIEHNPDDYLVALFDDNPGSFYYLIDSMVSENFSGFFKKKDVAFLITNNNGEVLYNVNCNIKNLTQKSLDNNDFFEAADVPMGKHGEFNILIPNLTKKRNQSILLFFMILWIMLCVVTLGFMIYMWEKQKRAQKIRLNVINNMMHEFKTPLTSIQLISEMIQQQGAGMKEQKLKNYAQIIHQECDKMLTQAKQILNTAYFSDVQFKLRMRKHNVHGLIKSVLASYEAIYSENEFKISTQFDAQIPYANIDRTHFQNVITNLIENARKYSKNAHSKLEILTYNDGNKILIEVKDNGIGIDHKHQKYIFDRFYRVNSGNVHEKSGYGVGLYYVKTILKRMKAHIRVKSKPDEGSTFIIHLRTQTQKTYRNGKK